MNRAHIFLRSRYSHMRLIPSLEISLIWDNVKAEQEGEAMPLLYEAPRWSGRCNTESGKSLAYCLETVNAQGTTRG